jgi:primosomal protein N' (replication factor Y)
VVRTGEQPGEDPGRDDGQLDLLPALARARAKAASASARAAERDRTPAVVEPAPDRPVAQVLVDVPLAHLDRPFDYLVPAAMHDRVVPGSRVTVRFAGQETAGFVLDRVEQSGHPGALAPLRRAVSAEPVLLPSVARLAAEVVERYAGTRADVLRLAVPPRHAATERRPSPPAPHVDADRAAAEHAWERYPAGTALLGALRTGATPRVVWTALPGEDWPRAYAHAAAVTAAAGRGVLLCVPDRRDLDRLDAALCAVLGPGRHALLAADLGPSARYRSFLAVARGAVRVVAGTRAAAFAPVHDLGLAAVWDDGDDLYAEPRAPYPHTREVLLLRGRLEATAVLLGGYARSVEAAALVAGDWAQEVTAPRAARRRASARVEVTGATDRELARDPFTRVARVPAAAHEVVRTALRSGPVLVQTPRAGYVPALVCDACRTPARCAACAGPLAVARPHQPPTCRWCGHREPGRPCPECGAHGLRAPVLGARRTAEELGRAFPGTPVRHSSGERVLDRVGPEPALVVATPGAEPVAEAGYAAVLLLDAWVLLARPDLRVAEEALRRWSNAAALARPADAGGRVVVVGDPADPAVQALVRGDPGGFAARELEQRQAAHLPPAARLATITGAEDDLTAALAELTLPPGTEVLGPVVVSSTSGAQSGPAAEGSRFRLLLRTPRASGPALSRTLRHLQGTRAAHKLPPVRVQVDPVALE